MTGLLNFHSLSDDDKKWHAWNNVPVHPNYPNGDAKVDCDGRWMVWSAHGEYTTYGWHIDHIHPTALGGGDFVTNLRARNWQGNTSAGGILGGLLR